MALFGFGKKGNKKPFVPQLLATQNGTVKRLEDVDDPVFAGKILGDGFAIVPESNEVLCPINGTISVVHDTFHAYGITAPDGTEVLVHIGLNTVSLGGEGFKAFVKTGQKVNAGDKLAVADLDFIKSKGISTDTIVLISNIDEIKDFDVNYGLCTAGETSVLTYTK